ncbi:MAG: vitamin K epoxide reductase family protein [Candidatus Spechtbacterales bacterium]
MKYHRILVGAMIVLATIGFFIAFYLTIEHYLGGVPACSFLSGCEVVTTSEYATLWGVPISLFGAGYFLSIATLLLAYLQTLGRRFFLIAGGLVATGGLVALGLIYVQVAVLGAVCIYCASSDAISLVLALLFIGAYKTSKQ